MIKAKIITITALLISLLLCSCGNSRKETVKDSNPQMEVNGSPSVDSSATTSNKESSGANESLTGKFVSDDDGSTLTITAREDGRYNVVVELFRLTSLDDGMGVDAEGGIDFTATDAAGNPIGGRITFAADMATLTFVRSTWSLIENGAKWEFKRK